MHRISPVALPVRRSELFLRWVMSTIRNKMQHPIAGNVSNTAHEMQSISLWKLPDRKPQPLTAESQCLQQSMNERWCRMCIQSTGWVYPLLWHTSGAEQPLQVLGTHFCRAGAWKKHHSFLYAPVPTFPSTGKEEAEAKSESEEHQSLRRYLGSIFVIQEPPSAGMKIIHRWPGKLMKRWHILEFLYDRV